MPGLINTHTHGADSLFRGLIDDLPLEPWLERLWVVERQILSPETVGAGARLAYAEMIRGGTTTALDMFWYPEASAKAAREVGFRVLTGPIWFDSTEIDGLTPDERSRRGVEFMQEYRRDPLITPACFLTAPTPSHRRSSRGLAISRRSSASCSRRTSQRPQLKWPRSRASTASAPRHLDDLGMLGPRTVLAHCVHLDAEEIDLLADRRTVVAHCPLSNLKLGSGVAPLEHAPSRCESRSGNGRPGVGQRPGYVADLATDRRAPQGSPSGPGPDHGSRGGGDGHARCG